MKTFAFALAALVAGVSIASSAMAAEATRSINVRSGPGTSYRIVDSLFRGENVNVRRCRSNGWCYITHPGPDGWVSARYLRDNRGGRYGPNINFTFSFGGSGGGGNNEELVCLVTFFDASDVAAGADADVESARLLPRSEAELRDRPNDRRGIFDYGTNRQTRDTCEYLDNLNN